MINNKSFSGDYELLIYILKKYKTLLPYLGSVQELARQYKYDVSSPHKWKSNGVPTRVWLTLQKDLTIIFLMGKLDQIVSLEDLKIEFNKIDK